MSAIRLTFILFLALIALPSFTHPIKKNRKKSSVQTTKSCNVEVSCVDFNIKINYVENEKNKTVTGNVNCGDFRKRVWKNRKRGIRASTKSGTGRVGPIHWGKLVPRGIQIRGIRGMGNDGGGKVFHTSNRNGSGRTPRGANSSEGCIHISPKIQKILENKCRGARLKVTGNKEAAIAYWNIKDTLPPEERIENWAPRKASKVERQRKALKTVDENINNWFPKKSNGTDRQ